METTSTNQIQRKTPAALQVADSLCAQLAAHKIELLTQIQTAVYAPLMANEPVVGLAPTGSGKTLAFGLPAISRASEQAAADVQTIIVTPSQELVAQTHQALQPYAQALAVNVVALAGGANIKRQLEKLKTKPQIVIGTLGRLLELSERKKLKLAHVQTIIFDEADDLLQPEDTLTQARTLVQRAPGHVNLAFFSATASKRLFELHRWFGVEPTIIDVRKTDDTQGEVVHYLVQVPMHQKAKQLIRLARVKHMRALVFCNTIAAVRRTLATLRHNHVAAASLDSNQPATKRKQALAQLRSGKIKLLLTTDVAARGLDIVGLPAVINYDVPRSLASYIHRVGRTGRMNTAGMVINVGDDHDCRDYKRLVKTSQYHLVAGRVFADELLPVRQAKAAARAARAAKAAQKAATTTLPHAEQMKAAVQAPTAKTTATKKKKKRKQRWRNQKNKGRHNKN